MAATEMVFKRYEKKYLLTKEQYEVVNQALLNHMQMDQFGKHTICNLYYDTDYFDLIRHSLEKPIYKEKLRMRSYGTPTTDDEVFLEIKKKFKGIVYKRRERIPLNQAYMHASGCVDCEQATQIAQEIAYMVQRYQPVPKLFLAYDRIALYHQVDSQLRITFDFDIRSRDYKLRLEEGDQGELLMSEGEVVMEIKTATSYPLWLIGILEEFDIRPVSYSKYGKIYQKSLHTKFLDTMCYIENNCNYTEDEENDSINIE